MVQTVERVKVSFNLTQEDVTRLKELASAQGISATEALRRAIATERFVVDTYRNGAKLLIEQPDKTVRELVFR